MSRCLREKDLVWLQAGDGKPDQHRHLAECSRCAARFGQLRDDLALIGRVLEGKAAGAWRFRRPSRFQAWLPAAAVALVLVTALNGVFAWYWTRLLAVPSVPTQDAVAADLPPSPLDADPYPTWRSVTFVEESLPRPQGDGENAWLREDLQSLPLGDLGS